MIKTKFVLKGFNMLALVYVLLVSSCAEKVTPLDWPQFKKDNFRSACIQADLDLAKFGKRWMYDTGQEPIPAWYGPAKEDAYARSGALPSMRDYDLSYYPIVVGNSLYYASSADDAVHCHDTKTGEEKWIFTTEAPIRIAPTYYEGKIYVGSDDGFVYCLNARSGSLDWKYSPTVNDRERLLNNGRFISFYPIRTGVLIEDGIAYFGASLLPWKKSYVCAVDAETGKIGKKGTYVKEYDNNSMTLEGSMASTGTMLIQPQGRIAPVFIKKENGETAGNLAGTGGCFVLVTPELNVVHGKSSRYISLEETKMEEKQPEFMSYKDGKEMLVKGDSAYVLNDNSLVSYNRKTQKMIWLRNHFRAQRIIIAGDVLFAGGTDFVIGISLKNGHTLWKTEVKGTVYAMSFARNVLYASTAEGYIYAFAEDGKGKSQYFAENVNKEPLIQKEGTKKKEVLDSSLKSCIANGPFVHPLSVDSVMLSFDTYDAMNVNVDWNTNADVKRYVSVDPVIHHEFRIPVRKGMNYDYCLVNEEGIKSEYNYDNFFNFFTRSTDDFPEANNAARESVCRYLQNKKLVTGLCLIWGDDSEETAFALAGRTPLNVVNIESSERKYNKFIKELQKRKSYGRKLAALLVDDENKIPVISDIADLVWVNDGEKIDPDEVIRLIAPNKFAVITGLEDSKYWLSQSTLDWQVTVESDGDKMLVLKKNPIENIGIWTHQHGDLRNASYGGESLFGSTRTEDFETQWMGRPGARFITDRSGRKPAPLAVDGRLFMQGKERIAAMSVYNGSLLWMKDMPGVIRMNIAHDCSNWASDETHLFVVSDNKLLKINQTDGAIEQKMYMHIPNDTICQWGFVGVTPTAVLGTTTVKGAPFTNYHGGGNEGWYDVWEGPNAYKVLSKRLFSLDKKTGDLLWEYNPQGVIVNATICSYEGKLMFVESRSADKESRRTGRGGDDLYKDTRLVALDLHTGEMVYENRFKAREGKTVFFMVANSGKCVIVSSYKGYDILAFDVATGKNVWSAEQEWFHSDHGAHMSKPAIAGDRLVVKPAVYNVHTGERQKFNTPKVGHGCAHYALSDNAMFYRGGSCTIFDFNNHIFSKWERLRPDCWLSTIPAQGMVLSPEAAGGCSCGMWYETSMVFAPISRAPVAIMGITEDSRRDNMHESWGNYASSCNTDEFTDSLVVELALKPGLHTKIYYTIDGTEPTKESTVYTNPITLTESADVKVAVFIEKAGKERRFTRSRYFEKIKVNKEDKE